ncbi:hypothetical protein CBL_07306 [Carabus blaptoides fortunei]
MKFSIIFVVVLAVLAAFAGQTEAAPRWKGWKKIERVGQRVLNVAQKFLPIAAHYVALAKGK